MERRRSGRNQNKIVRVCGQNSGPSRMVEVKLQIVINFSCRVNGVITSIDEDLRRRRHVPDEVAAPVEIIQHISGKPVSLHEDECASGIDIERTQLRRKKPKRNREY